MGPILQGGLGRGGNENGKFGIEGQSAWFFGHLRLISGKQHVPKMAWRLHAADLLWGDGHDALLKTRRLFLQCNGSLGDFAATESTSLKCASFSSRVLGCNGDFHSTQQKLKTFGRPVLVGKYEWG